MQTPPLALRTLAALALVALAIPLLTTVFGGYGVFIDEFYYVACSERLDFGYVDHPPLAPLLLRASRAVLGDSAVALRVLPALFAAATVFLTGLLARRLGAGPWGQSTAALATLASPLLLALFGMFSVNAFEVFWWLAASFVAVEIALRGDLRLWALLGAVLGIGLQFKHTTVFLGIALVAGLLLTRERRQFATRWPFIGGAVAFALVLPNLAWQAAHGWPSLEFYRNAALYKNEPAGPHEVILMQLVTVGLGALALWLAGLRLCFRDARLRHLGWAYVVLLLLLVVSAQSRPDRIAGIYPLLFAAGGAALETARRRAVRWLVPASIVVLALPIVPMVIPVLPPAALERYAGLFGGPPQVERGAGKASSIPQLLADRLEWEKLVDDVAEAAARLAPSERENAVIIAQAYGPAGAIELLGRGRGLPPVYAVQNSYHSWGPPRGRIDAAIVLDDSEERLRELALEVELVKVHDCDHCMPWRDGMTIWIVRRPKVDLAALWPTFKRYE